MDPVNPVDPNQAILPTKNTAKTDKNQMFAPSTFNIKQHNKQNPIPVHFIRF